MKNEKQNIGLAVQPYVEGCFHSTSTLACCFMPTYAKSGVRHLYIMGVYSTDPQDLSCFPGVRHLYIMGVYSCGVSLHYLAGGVRHLYIMGVYSHTLRMIRR